MLAIFVPPKTQTPLPPPTTSIHPISVYLSMCVLVDNGDSNNISLHAMAFGSKMDKPSSSQEGGVVGLNFHQSKEVLINDSNGSIYTVGFTLICNI